MSRNIRSEIGELEAGGGGADTADGRSRSVQRGNQRSKRAGSGLGQWVREQLNRNSSLVVGESRCWNNMRSDLRLLLGVMGAPFALVHVSTTDPMPHLSIQNTPIIRPLFHRGNCCTWRRQGSFL